MVKVLHSICQAIWKTQQWPQDWKRSVFIPMPKKCNAKESSNYHTIALISHASKVMFKILQARLQQYVNCELPDVQVGFRKGRGTRNQTTNVHWIGSSKKQESSRKTLLAKVKFFTLVSKKSRRRQWHPTPVLLPGKSQGWGSQVGCRLWGCTESDTTEAT